MRLRNQAHGQFWLCANRIQSGGVEDNQALFEQRMRDINQRMPPTGHLHPPLRILARVVFGRFVVPKTERLGLINAHLDNFRDLLECCGQLLRVVHIQVNSRPLLRGMAPLHQRLAFQACFDGQQSEARRHIAIPAQLGRAHCRSARACRHDPAAIGCKKDRVDQLGFATGEFCDEGHHDLIGAHLRFELLQPFSNGCIHQVLPVEPISQLLQARCKFSAPSTVRIKLLVK